MIKWLVIFMLFATPAMASEVVCFNPFTFNKSANTPDFVGNPDCLINPDLTALSSVRRIYWKRVADTVIAMTISEQLAVDAAAITVRDASLRAGSISGFSGQNVTGLQYRALVETILDEINILRTQHGLTARTLAQAKTAITNKINNGDVDE